MPYQENSKGHLIEKPTQHRPTRGIKDVKGDSRLDQGKEDGHEPDAVHHACESDPLCLRKHRSHKNVVSDRSKKSAHSKPEPGVQMDWLDQEGDEGNRDGGEKCLEHHDK